MKTIIRHYHSHPRGMTKEFNIVKALYSAACNNTLVNGKTITIDDVLEKCFTGNHFRYLHLTAQQRLNLTVNAVNALKSHNILNSNPVDFEDLYDKVKLAIGSLNQVGRLILYDTTKMIGHILTPQIVPQKYVYTQSGAKTGAKILLGKKRMSWRVPVTEFQQLFPNEQSIYVEDMLCIYKKYFTLNGVKKGVTFSNGNNNPNPNIKTRCCNNNVNPKSHC